MKKVPIRKPKMANETKLSKAEQAKKLIQQANELIEGAKQEQLVIINEAITELKELGFSYTLAEAGGKQPTAVKKTPTAPKTAPGEVYCSVCDLKGHHDKRAHRGQKENLRKFTPEELVNVKPKAQAAATV